MIVIFLLIDGDEMTIAYLAAFSSFGRKHGYPASHCKPN